MGCSCQQYRLSMALTLPFHHYPRVKKETTVKWYWRNYIFMPCSLWFISRQLACLEIAHLLFHWSAISPLHRAMWESDFMLLLFLNSFCVCGKGQILKIRFQLGLLSTLKKKKQQRLHIHLSFIQLHQTHLVLFISFKFILSKINLNVNSFPALPTGFCLNFWWPYILVM